MKSKWASKKPCPVCFAEWQAGAEINKQDSGLWCTNNNCGKSNTSPNTPQSTLQHSAFNDSEIISALARLIQKEMAK